MKDLSDIRSVYDSEGLNEESADSDPLRQLSAWLDSALEAGALEPTAMTLATVCDGQPRARTVLLKGIDRGLLFYTNYESAKSRELDSNPRAGACLFWAPVHRQVRIEGRVERAEPALCDRYFASRPRGSQIGAWASPQSQVIESRDQLESRTREIEARFPEPEPVPRPPFWGGFRLLPQRFEFWQGRPDRLHDRLEYLLANGVWSIRRLAP